MQALNGYEVKSITFAETMRNIGANLGIQPAKERHVDAGRRNPIDIVVAVKTDRLLSRHRTMQPFNRLLHVGNQKRIVRRLQRHPGGGFIGRSHATSQEQRGGGRRNGEGLD